MSGLLNYPVLAIIFALIAFVGWGTGDIFGGLVARKIGGYSAALFSTVISLIVASFFIPLFLTEIRNLNTNSIIWLIILAPFNIIPMLTLYEGIHRGNAPLVGTIAGSYGALVALLSVIFLGESLNYFQIISVLLIFIGVVFSSLDLKSLSLSKALSDKGVPFALISLFSWSFFFTFIKIPIRQVGWFWAPYISWWSFPLAIIYMKFRSIKINFPHDPKHIFYLLINGVFLTAALFALNWALAIGKSSVVTPIASSYPALFAAIAYFVFKDKLTRQQTLGIIVTLAGIVGLSVLSS